MVAILQQQLGLVQEMLLQVRDLPAYSHGAQGGFPANVGVCARYDRLDFGEQVSGHLDRGNVSEGAEGEADGVLVGVVQVAVERQSLVIVQCSCSGLPSYFFREFVTRVRTSWFSSSSNMVPR